MSRMHKPARRAATISVVLMAAVGGVLLALAALGSASADPPVNAINITMGSCGSTTSFTYHFVAPQRDTGTGGTITVTYHYDGEAAGAHSVMAAEDTTSNNSSNAQWFVTISFDGHTSITVDTAVDTAGDSYQGQGSSFATVTSSMCAGESATSTPTMTPTGTLTPTMTPTNTSTPTMTPTGTLTPTMTPTGTLTPTMTPTNTLTPTMTPTGTLTPTMTPTGTNTPTMTPTATRTSTNTSTPTKTPTVTNTPGGAGSNQTPPPSGVGNVRPPTGGQGVLGTGPRPPVTGSGVTTDAQNKTPTVAAAVALFGLSGILGTFLFVTRRRDS